jgi:hypothetical protein
MSRKLPKSLSAIEGARASMDAYRQWKSHFQSRSEKVSPEVLWDETSRVAATFWEGKRRGRPVFWVAFAHTAVAFRQNLLVEVNPPRSGISLRFQGVFAEDLKGNRFVLHRGELHPGRDRISPSEFFDACTVPQSLVAFSDGSSARCAMVSPLDEGSNTALDATAQFISDCANVRSRLSYGIDTALEKRLFDLEQVTPELRGEFVVPWQAARRGVRRHGEVWKRLHDTLEALNLAPANSRLGIYGPDLYTRCSSPMLLFEIKSRGDSGSVQQAIGQLLIYEQLLDQPVIKVLVVPSAPSKELQGILAALDVAWIAYGSHAAPSFDLTSIVRRT